MKIIIPTNNQVSISIHCLLCKGFVYVDIENNKIVSKLYKTNTFNKHLCEIVSHDDYFKYLSVILEEFKDCDAVITGGMGEQLCHDLTEHNIQVFITKEENIDTAIDLLLKNKLSNKHEDCCKPVSFVQAV